MKGKHLVLFLMMCLLLVTVVSAAEWDNCKEISEDQKEVKIKDNCLFGLDIPYVTNEIATITLDTPLNYKVGGGYQKVAQMTIKSKKDYNNAISLFEFFNKGQASNSGGDWKDYEENIEFDLKYLAGYNNITWNEKEYICGKEYQAPNGTMIKDCVIEDTGKVLWRLDEDWKPLIDKDFKKDVNITIAIFTYVLPNDKFEWIPKMAGEKIPEWAEWTASLNVDLTAYYPFEENSTTTSEDVTGNGHELTGFGTPGWSSTCKIGNCADLNRGSSEYWVESSPSGDFNYTDRTFTINFWLYPKSVDNYEVPISLANDDSSAVYRWGVRRIDNTNAFRGLSRTNVPGYILAGGPATVGLNTWVMITYMVNSSGGYIYYNGSQAGFDLDSDSLLAMTELYSMSIGSLFSGGSYGSFYEGKIDEVGLWDRSLSPEEITQLYNGGTGITYIDIFGVTPVVELINPATNITERTSTQFKSYNFSCNSTESINLSLIINGTTISTITNSTPSENLTIAQNYSIVSGVNNWTCTGWSLTTPTTAPTQYVNHTYININIDNLAPPDNFVTNLTSYNFTANVTSISTNVVNSSIYFNGVLNQTNSTISQDNVTFQIDHIPEGINTWYFDAWCTDGVHYFSNANWSYIISDINITQINPADNSKTTDGTVNFNCTAETTIGGMFNLTLNIDGVSNFTVTNSTPNQNLTIDVLRTLNDGDHNWSCMAYNSNSFSQSQTRTLSIDTVKPLIVLSAPETSQGLLNNGDTLKLNWTMTDVNPGQCSYGYGIYENLKAENGKSYNSTEDAYFWFYVDSSRDEYLTTIGLGSPINGRLIIYKQNGSKNSSNTEVQLPLGNINVTLNLTAFGIGDGWHYLRIDSRGCSQPDCVNWTKIRLEDENRNPTSFLINNSDVACDLNTTDFSYISGQDEILFYANDTFGNSNFTTRSWSIQASILDEAFITPVVEGSNNLFYITFDVTGPVTITDIDLVYNGTINEATFDTIGNQYNASLEFIAPNIEADTNLTFFWQITYNDSTQVNSTAHNQTVTLLVVDDCSVNNFTLLNFSLLDEESQEFINATVYNTTVEVELSLFAEGTSNRVLHFFQNYSENSNPKVCLAEGLGTATFDMILLVQYRGDDYATEEYNVIGGTITNDSITTNISLYDLLSADSTEFLITYKDESFTAIEDALIQIQRKYISEGVFKTVELPKTDQFGQTKGHFDTDKGIYTFVVVKDGVIIALFNETTVVCQDVLLGDCDLNLNELVSDAQFSDWDTFGDVSILQTWDEPSRTITTHYSSTSGSVVTMNITTTKFDRFENTTVCTDSLLSASGTLSCVVPDSFGNITIISKTRVDGVLVETQSYSITPDITKFFGVSSYVFLLILLLTIPFMLASSTIGVIFGAIVGFLMAGMLMIYDGGSSFGSMSSIVWLIISGGIIIWKIANRE